VTGEREVAAVAGAAGCCWSSSWSSSSHLCAESCDEWRRDSIHSWAIWSLGAASVKSRDDVKMANATIAGQRGIWRRSTVWFLGFNEGHCVYIQSRDNPECFVFLSLSAPGKVRYVAWRYLFVLVVGQSV